MVKMKYRLTSFLAPVLLSLCVFSQANAETHVVVIKKFKFIPQHITIKAGDTIRWENHEKRQYHSVWFEASGEPEPDYFFPEESYEKTFNKAGTLPYRCGPHPKMTGSVTVNQ
ncbi:MAG: plastocyanin/azurin family copper-binding protein [Gammaproteobacteria bacterium]|nr:plastocyanin/azurin family copper-binding protein [Gammaproteobacteria bacterium]